MLQAIGIFLSFVTVIVLVNRKVDTGLSLFAASLVAAATSGLSPADAGRVLVGALTEPDAWELAAVIVMVWIIGKVLRDTGALEIMLEAMKSMIPDTRLLVALIPSVIGLISVPGGAVISAPMIDKPGDELGMPVGAKTAANIIYRHIWYPIFPIYPGFIIVVGLSGVSTSKLVLMGLPVVAATFAATFYFTFRGTARAVHERTEPVGTALRRFLQSMGPLLLAILLVLFFDMNFAVALAIGVSLAVFNYIDYSRGLSWVMGVVGRRLREQVLGGFRWQSVSIALGLYTFRAFLEASGIVTRTSEGLVDLGIPLFLLAVIVPIVVGYLTGMNIASLALVLPFFVGGVPAAELASVVFLVFISSSIGYYISPIHICLILTQDHLKCGYAPFFREAIPPLVVMLLSALLVFFLF